ncbi:hypothetical protein JXA84_00655 [candidate division WOR-3 bacterium]|nr:hypothetical protein [candidate division WOR-3 bacterium]
MANTHFSKILSTVSSDKFGVYLRTLNNTLVLCKTNTDEIPKELTPSESLTELSSKICEGVYFFEKQPLCFFLLGDKPNSPSALILLDKKTEDKSMLQTMSFFYQVLYLLRREKITSMDYDIIFSGKDPPFFLKGDKGKTARVQEFLKENKKSEKIESVFLLPEEEIYGIKKRNESFSGKIDVVEKISFIKKHAESLQREFDRGSPYFTELSTISGMASRIIESLEH